MIILSNSIAQTLAPGQSATFDTIVEKTGCAECFRRNSGTITVRNKPAVYDVDFGANIGATTVDTAQLAILYDGSPLLETTALSNTDAVGDLNHIYTATSVKMNCCDGGGFTIANTGTTTITIGANPIFKVRRMG